MEADLKKQWSRLVQWGKTYFSETFTSWIHLKAVRLFVESVLRYGLPANFQGALLEPTKKKEKQLRQVLDVCRPLPLFFPPLFFQFCLHFVGQAR